MVELVDSKLQRLRSAGVIAILRGTNPERLLERGLELAEMGCTAIEVTLDSPNALEVVEHLHKRLSHSEIMIGVGTLLDSSQIQDCAAAGAEFVLSPTNPEHMIERCHAEGLLAIPGVANPHDMRRAIEDGAKVVKLFPASNWELENLDLIETPWIPVGGIDCQTAFKWLQRGAFCIGMGANLCGSDLNDPVGNSDIWMGIERPIARDMFMELQRYHTDT